MIRRLRIPEFDIDMIQTKHEGRWIKVETVAPKISPHDYWMPHFPGAEDRNSLMWRY